MTKSVSDIKRAQKASLLFRLISNLFLEASIDDDRVKGLCISQIKLSPDKSYCYVFFYAIGGKKEFDEKFPFLKLYKPSLRAAIAKEINSRYTPEIVFKFDEVEEKSRKINDLIDRLKEKGEL